MNNKQKLLTATAITGTIVSASAFTVFDYAICRRKKQPDVRKKEKWKPYLDYVLKEQEWLKEHQEQELKEIRSKDGLTLRAAYIPRENAKGTIICMHGYHQQTISNSYRKSDFYGILDTAFFFHGREATEKVKDAILLME